MINFRKKRENPEDIPEVVSEDIFNCQEEISETEIVAETVQQDNPESETDSGMEKFMAEARGYAQGKGIAEEQLAEALELIEGLRKLRDEESPALDVLVTVLNGLDYERAVSESRIAGELEGRNKQIEEVYMRPETSDGLPHLGNGGSSRKPSRGIASIFDLARSAG